MNGQGRRRVIDLCINNATGDEYTETQPASILKAFSFLLGLLNHCILFAEVNRRLAQRASAGKDGRKMTSAVGAAHHPKSYLGPNSIHAFQERQELILKAHLLYIYDVVPGWHSSSLVKSNSAMSSWMALF